MVLEDFDTFNQNRFFTDVLILTLSHFFIVVRFQAMPFGHFFEGPRLFDSRTMSNNEKKLLQQHFFLPFIDQQKELHGLKGNEIKQLLPHGTDDIL